MEKQPRGGGGFTTRDDIFASQQQKYTCLQTNYYYIKNTGHCGVITFYQI